MSDKQRKKRGPTDPLERPSLGGTRLWAFRIVAIGLVLIPLLSAELICRWFGFGGYPPIFKPLQTVEGKTYIGSFQPGIDTFFHRQRTITGGMHEQVFTSPKAPDTVRIVCVGGSAMQGYPQPRMLAAATFFEAMLTDLWPDRDVEVLNLGTTAIASFPVACILDAALHYEPDLVVIYSGNNEFYGAFGVASVHAFGRSTMAMHVARATGRSALVQWLTKLRTNATQHELTPEEAERTLMERVIMKPQIGQDDRLRRAAERNLSRHLRHMIGNCRRRGVPVIVCTLPANERDLWPIGEDLTPPLSVDSLASFEGNLEEAESLLDSDPEAAAARVRSALQLHDQHAKCHFVLGRALSALGRAEDAQQEYKRARELDTMPWRAPSSFNEVVRQVVVEGAILCDLQQTFQAASPDGVIGWDLMDDHVHPSLRGQALIAESWLRSMADLPEPLGVDGDALIALPDWHDYAARLGNNPLDTYAAAQRMVSLFQAPFYRRSNPQALERFELRLTEIEAGWSEIEKTAVKFWQDPQTHESGARPITGIVGAGLMTEGRYEEADRLLCIARHNVSTYSLWNLELTWKALQCRRHLHPQPRPEDVALAHELIRDGENLSLATGVSSPPLHRLLGLTYHLLGQHDLAIRHLSVAFAHVRNIKELDVVQALTNSLVATGQLDRARQLLGSAPRDRELRAAFRQLLDRLDALPREQPFSPSL